MKGPVLIEIARLGLQGCPCRYSQGQSLAVYVPKALKTLDDGQLEANLTRYYTAQGQAYFVTVEGCIELARLLSYIKTHKVKPELR